MLRSINAAASASPSVAAVSSPFLRGRAPYVFCVGGLPEQGRDGGLTPLLGVLAGGQAVVDGGDADVGPGRDQDPHRVDVPLRAVAEDHRLVERGPAEVVHVIHVDARPHQPSRVAACPRSVARISAVPLNESLLSRSAPCAA